MQLGLSELFKGSRVVCGSLILAVTGLSQGCSSQLGPETNWLETSTAEVGTVGGYIAYCQYQLEASSPKDLKTVAGLLDEYIELLPNDDYRHRTGNAYHGTLAALNQSKADREVVCPEVEQNLLVYKHDLARVNESLRGQSGSTGYTGVTSSTSSTAYNPVVVPDFTLPVPAGQVTFGAPDANGTRSVLVNTDGGTVQCQITDSGYTFCN